MAVEVALATIPIGQYINGWEVLPVLVVLFAWARLMTWADKDAADVQLPRSAINSGNWAGLVLALALFFLLPVGFWIAFSLYVVIFLAEIGIYLSMRKQKVGLADLSSQFSNWKAGLKGKEKPVEAAAGQVQVLDRSGNPLPAPEAESPDRPAYDAAQRLLTEPLRRDAERIELTPSGEAASVIYMVDGVRYETQPMDRGAGAAAVTYLKTAAGMDIAERRKPQKAAFKTFLDGNKREMQIQTKGSSAGESVLLIVEPKKRHSFTPDTLGFSPEQLQIVKQTIADGNGVVLLAAPQGQGLTALEYGFLRGHDAFLQHLITLEHQQEQDIEGVTQNALAPNAPAGDEAKQAAWVASQEPDAVLLDYITDTNAARELIKFAAQDGRRAYFGLRAGNTFDALRQWRKIIADDNLAMKHLKLIVAGRTIRRLCSACKIAYAPEPALLKKLNMDPAAVPRLYQARTTPMRDAKGNLIPCTFCSDLGFKGRTGVYELLVIDDTVRQVIRSNGSDNELKAAFRKQKSRYLQEMALALVEIGETSVNEVQRVLRPAAEAPPARRQA